MGSADGAGAGDGGIAVMLAPGAGHGGFAGAMPWCEGFRGSLASHRAHSSFGKLC